MAAKLGSLYFNELDFKTPPIFIENESVFKHRKDISADNIIIKIAGSGFHTMQIGLRRNVERRLFLTISMYDDQFRLADRRDIPMASLVTSMQAGADKLAETIVPAVQEWLCADNPAFYYLLVSSIGRSIEALQEEARTKVKDGKKPANPMANQQHRIYHSHRTKTSAA